MVGRINRATKSMLRLLDAQGKTIDVLRSDIEEMRESSVSMMPDNVALTISAEQFADLVAYLETLHYAVITGFRGPNQAVEVTRIERPVRFVPIHSAEMKFANPVWCGALPGVAGQLIVLEQQEAKVWRLERTADGIRRHLFLDLGGQVKIGQNWGLMCLAFHPQFTTNRRYFLKHEVEEQPTVKTTVVERLASEDLLNDLGTPSRRLFEVEQPAFNHNGGCIAFGPDGMLYIGFGDGGFQRDPSGNGQNLHIARQQDAAHRRRSSIRGQAVCNPARQSLSEDTPAGSDDIARDLGNRSSRAVAIQLRRQDRQTLGRGRGAGQVRGGVSRRAGENHGWNVYEGFEPFSDEYRRAEEKFSFPLFAYPHSFGVSVTGGYVLSGQPSRELRGCLYLWRLRYAAPVGTERKGWPSGDRPRNRRSAPSTLPRLGWTRPARFTW